MRPLLGRLHRWAGLLTAAFLFFSGVTGAVISWDHELDDLLNPHLMEAKSDRPAMPSVQLAALIEQRDPRASVAHIYLAPEAGGSLAFFIRPRVDPATGQRYKLDYNQIFLDPGTGEELGRRKWGAAWPVTSENFVSFLYQLHYTMHIPTFWGSDRWGVRLLGIIALIWTIDCIVGFVLTLPAKRRATAATPEPVARQLRRGFWARWAPAWKVKTSASRYRLNFDIHRAFGLWTWGLLFVIAFTAFSLNLFNEVFSPIMRTVSNYTPTPYEQRTPTPIHQPILPKRSYAEILERAQAEGRSRGWEAPVGSLGYADIYGIYRVAFFKPGDGHGASGVGPPRLYYDGEDGRLLGAKMPWVGTAADIFVQAQFPVHSGRILGLPGRILISIMGLVVAALSVTGVVIWWRKRKARVARRREQPAFRAVPAE